ncbi:MAG: pilus assembly PilX N-terminal domain-containing protein [Acidobacteriia bacterium]|nr:pilus assembly PilX N-terminal domain-containing protein [Terriglobia bacterium]
MRDTAVENRKREAGSAMVIAILVVVILTLLGVSFLLMADTENRIAENEKLSAQALYFGESGVRMVKRWFDSPGSSSNLLNPSISVIDRTLRKIDDDGDPLTAWHLQDGATWPRYKQGVDLNADGVDDVFDKPFRGGATSALRLKNTLLGTKDGPDMRITEGYSTAAKTFLGNLSTALIGNFPAATAGVKARISTIDVYGPPYVNVGGTWTRFGMATVEVTARIYKTVGGVDQILAERLIKAVINETPYPGPMGPLHSCFDINYNGSFNVHWGPAIAVGPSDVPNNFSNKMAHSIPRDVPPSPRLDLLYGWNSPSQDAIWTALKTNLEAGVTIEDPWFRYLGGGAVADWQPPNGAHPNQVYLPITTGQDQSNLFQGLGSIIGCPDFDYDFWKEIAVAGGDNIHYYTWVSGTTFRENGVGSAVDFTSIGGQTGLFFFDTKDGNRPSTTLIGTPPLPDNLTPGVHITGSSFGVHGFLYLNMTDFRTTGSPGVSTQFTMPGEPFRDVNQNGTWDAGEGWINLNYTSLGSLTDTIRGSAADNFGGGAVYNAAGPTFTADAVVDGVLYTNGAFASEGTPRYYGSVISKGGVPGSAGTADIYWNDSLRTNFPPASWNLPRVMITRWETDM